MAATILIWAGFAVNMRAISSSSLASGDLALLRFVIPAVVLLPWWKSTWMSLRSQSVWGTLTIVLGAGLPFTLLVGWGASETSAALVGTVTPGIVPLYVGLYSVLVLRKTLGMVRSVGIAVISAGVAVALMGTGTSITWGVIPLLAGGMLWAAYTVALAHTRYTPVQIAVLLSVPSSVLALGAVGLRLLPSALVTGQAQINDVMLFALMQGIIVGILSTVLYSFATKTIGSLAASGFGALSPVLSAALAIPLLGEFPSPTTLLCLGLVTAGVLIANVVSNLVPSTARVSGSSRTAVPQGGLRSSAAPLLPAGHRGS